MLIQLIFDKPKQKWELIRAEQWRLWSKNNNNCLTPVPALCLSDKTNYYIKWPSQTKWDRNRLQTADSLLTMWKRIKYFHFVERMRWLENIEILEFLVWQVAGVTISRWHSSSSSLSCPASFHWAVPRGTLSVFYPVPALWEWWATRDLTTST